MVTRLDKDLLSGLLFSAVGTGFFAAASSYQMGHASDMGPGYFPRLLAGLLMLLGVCITLKSVVQRGKSHQAFGAIAWRPLIFIVLANLLFGVCIGGLPVLGIPPLGLMLGVVALTFCASLAHTSFSVKKASIVSVILALGSYLLFIVFLKQNIPVWPVLA